MIRRFLKLSLALQIAFTYIGTVVGAGFATGAEIVQFFTQYGVGASISIAFATFLFIWLGMRLMLLSSDIGARSFEDLNQRLFGPRLGIWISHFMLVVLLGVTSVMLAGAGTLFNEQFAIPYSAGLLLTASACFVFLLRGVQAIMLINTLVVPFMIVFTLFIIGGTIHDQVGNAPEFVAPAYVYFFSPILYCAFNLSMAQTVLAPLGGQVIQRKVIVWGTVLGGIGIGFLLLCGHLALLEQWNVVQGETIPMRAIAWQHGEGVQSLYTLLIFAEIFTTLLANVFGIALQLNERWSIQPTWAIVAILIFCYTLSQLGFLTLLRWLYPAFGFISLAWLGRLLFIRVPELQQLSQSKASSPYKGKSSPNSSTAI